MKSILFIYLSLVSIAAIAINPSRVYERTPKDFDLTFKKHLVKTPDNLDINVWEYEPNEAAINQTIIFVGPDAGNMSNLIWQAKHFRDKGFRVITFDYRGFGKSSDFEINRDFLFHSEFAIDLDSVIQFTKDKYPDSPIGLYALSMGTYISLLKEQPVDYIIAEGFYNNPKAVVKRIKELKNKEVFLPENTSIIPNLPAEEQMLIFYASKDNVTTPEDAKNFATNQNVEAIEFIGTHLAGFYTMTNETPGDRYLERIVNFLK